jgi:ABC-type Fe3+/spermidine/putrescine transport system ATPase subunit
MTGPDEHRVELPWGTFCYEGLIPTHGKKDVMICIRPKDISLHTDDPQTGNTFRAKIVVKTFAGDFYKFLIAPVEKPEIEVLVHIYDYEKAGLIGEGETVYVYVPPACCQLIAV